MPQELIQFDARKGPTRIVLILISLVATILSFYAFRWYLGNTMAEYFNTGENNLDLAQVAKNLAPADPLTHWRLGQVSQKQLPLDQSAPSLAEYEKAVGLSPNDYRYWMSLGTAREQAGYVAEAEIALRKAIALAPAYAYPHWYLGNLLLRSGRYEEAFAELKKASDADPQDLRPQLFNLIWAVYGNDFESLKKTVGVSSEARSQFALYLFNQSKLDDGLGMWNTISVEDKKANKEAGDQIIKTLLSNLRFHDALAVWNDLAPSAAYRAEIDRITDGSFEEGVSSGPDVIFGWQVKNSPQMEIGVDPEFSHNGSRSLRLVFQVRGQLDPNIASQVVPVSNNTTYDFTYFVRTAKLQTGGPPLIQIVDAHTGSGLVTSEPPSGGDSDWSKVTLTFKTSDKTEAVILKIIRASCGDLPVCPIFGSVWYDDFSLNRHK